MMVWFSSWKVPINPITTLVLHLVGCKNKLVGRKVEGKDLKLLKRIKSSEEISDQVFKFQLTGFPNSEFQSVA